MKIFAHISWVYATAVIMVALTLMILTFHILPKPYSRKLSAWMIRIGTFFSVEVKGKEGKRFLVMSESAYKSLTKKQIAQLEAHVEIIHSSLDTIEACGGGSARCMMAEIFLPTE